MRMAGLVAAAIVMVSCSLYYFLGFFLIDTFFLKGQLIARAL